MGTGLLYPGSFAIFITSCADQLKYESTAVVLDVEFHLQVALAKPDQSKRPTPCGMDIPNPDRQMGTALSQQDSIKTAQHSASVCRPRVYVPALESVFSLTG